MKLVSLSNKQPHLDMQVVLRVDFSDDVLVPLHAFADRLMREAYANFRTHANAMELCHVFRSEGEVLGFQFWKTYDVPNSVDKIIYGGKLRLDPRVRGRGLPVMSGLQYFIDQQNAFPRSAFYRLSMASVFGYTSLSRTLASYFIVRDALLENAEDEAARAVLVDMAGVCANESGYDFDRTTGLGRVGIVPSEETLRTFGGAYFLKKEPLEYIAANPGWKTNGCYLTWGWRISPQNIASQLAYALERL